MKEQYNQVKQMQKDYYEQYLKKSEIIECMPTSINRIGFLSQEVLDEDKDAEDAFLRLMVYLPEKNITGRFGTVTFTEVGDAHISSDNDSWIVCNQAFVSTEPNHKTGWYPIPNNEKGHLAKGLVNIDGAVYAYGMIRSVFKRTGVRQWENITTRKQHPDLYADVEASKETFVGDWVGFSALDGFGQNDLYAGGNRGDFWHYDGKAWSQQDLPANADISTIVCAPDGKVYIACRLGPVMRGREDRWEIIDPSKQITHSAWFGGSVYFASKDGRIYTVTEDEPGLQEAHFHSALPRHMLHHIVGIASCEECLVAYTSVQAYAYDGAIWHEIIELPSLSKHK